MSLERLRGVVQWLRTDRRARVPLAFLCAALLLLASCEVLVCPLLEGAFGATMAQRIEMALQSLYLTVGAGSALYLVFLGAARHEERVAETLRASEDRFRGLTALSADWFWESDAQLRITWLSGGAAVARLLGTTSAYGRPLDALAGLDYLPSALEGLRRHLEAREPFRDIEVARGDTRGAREIHVIAGEPRFDDDGEFIGYHGVGRDVTAKRRAETALEAAKRRLELAVHGGASGLWDHDVATGNTYVGEGSARAIGYSPAALDVLPMERMVTLAHPSEAARLRAAYVDTLRGIAPEFDVECRVRTASGDYKWLRVTGRVVERTPEGRALRMTGLVVDVNGRKRAELALRDAEERHRRLVDQLPDGLFVSSNGYIEYANPAAARILRARDAADLVGRRAIDFVHPDERDAHRERFEFLAQGPGENTFNERRVLRRDGTVATLESASVSFLERGRLVMQTMFRDVTEARVEHEKLAERERRLRDFMEASDEYDWETDEAWRYTYLSPRVEQVLGYAPAEMLGRTARDFMALGEGRMVDEWFREHAPLPCAFRGLVHRTVAKDGRLVWQSVSGKPVFDAAGRHCGYRGTGIDVTVRRQAEERIQHLATRDAVTGLPNRTRLAERAEEAIVAAARGRGRLALLCIDIDRFRLVNESLGHALGDALLRAVGERLGTALRRQDTLARTGANEFALLWDGLRSVEEATAVAQRIAHSLGRPFEVDGRGLNIGASVGIAVYPEDGATFADLLKHAGLALGQAKAEGGNAARRFLPAMAARVGERLALENDLRRALATGELVLHFQPVVSGQPARGDARVVGAEALVRWQHPRRGLLPPAAFIGVAEDIGLIRAIGEWTMDRALAQVGEWGALPGEPWLALNVSAQELAEGDAYVARLEAALARHKVDGRCVELEVTERALVGNAQSGVDTLRRIGELGVRLAIDDFGTGYSSLSYLRSLPIDKVKIDQAFVKELATNADDGVIVGAIARLARDLGLHVSAEGVEDDAQLARLVALGCEEWQGHRFSAPLEARAYEKLLRAGGAQALAS